MRITVIRGVAAAALLSAITLSVAGCVNAEQPANPSDNPTTSYGTAPVISTTSSAPATGSSTSGSGTSTSKSTTSGTTTTSMSGM